MNKQWKNLAKQAGLDDVNSDALYQFGKLVANAEWRECAKVLDAFAEDMQKKQWDLGAAAMRGAADTIRFRSDYYKVKPEPKPVVWMNFKLLCFTFENMTGIDSDFDPLYSIDEVNNACS